MSQRGRMRNRIGASESSHSEVNSNRQSAKAPNVEINIERMILEGFNPGDRDRIGDAVQSELKRIIVEQGIPSTINNSLKLSSLDGGEFSMTEVAHTPIIGNQLAHSIYGGISQIGVSNRLPSMGSTKAMIGKDAKR